MAHADLPAQEEGFGALVLGRLVPSALSGHCEMELDGRAKLPGYNQSEAEDPSPTWMRLEAHSAACTASRPDVCDIRAACRTIEAHLKIWDTREGSSPTDALRLRTL